MKKLVLSNIQAGVRKLGAIKATFEHLQESYVEAIANLIKGLIAGATAPVAIHGCVNSGSGANYNISAGAIYHNSEIFEIDAFVGTASGADVPVLSLLTTWRAGDPVNYSDGSTHNTHTVRKYGWSFAASGSGLADFSAVVTLKAKVLNDLLAAAPLASPALTGIPTSPTAAPGTNTTQIATTAFVKTALDNIIASAPGALDTLDELAAALGDDANFAASVTTALAGKVPTTRQVIAGAGLTGGGALSSDVTIDANPDNSTLEVSGDALRIKDGGVTLAKLEAGLIAHGVYTPTLTNVSNVDSSGAIQCQYMRVGSLVHVSGKISINASGAGGVVAIVGASLPIASDFGATEDCAGTFVAGDGSFEVGFIKADAANNRAEFNLISQTGFGTNYYFTFSYRII